ncbi:MAG: cbb3-type cytochrome c oxidase subunit I, partial [Gammaproteobacteria bacterium]|nr:cbb3-type cytochrome c oxidase subunit I [Gammaproteobacteria bacterium]
LILPTNEAGVSAYAPYAAALFTLSSLIALFISWLNIPGDIESLIYYEYLFWGGGHLLQFSHTCLLLFSWLLLSQYCGGKLAFSNNTVKWLFIILLLPLIYAAYIYLVYDVFSPEHRTEFTALMKYGGLVSIPLGFVVFWSFLKSEYKKTIDIAAAKAALICSFVLFLAGGVIGFMIQGVNVVIPAHYHGSIVGVTLAFMGVAYYLLPQMGYREPNWGIARVQPYIYGGGQLVQIIGWTIAGMNGVQRKSAGAAQGLDSLPEIANIAMKVASAGGGISIIGGFLFWIVMIRSMWVSNK